MSTKGVQQRVTLPPAAESARTARRLVADVLASVGGDDFTDTATLLTSELVTNGIVHAHTELHVMVEATRGWVRVEVIDGNAQQPSRRDYEENASTGRGMEMVELLADDYGVEPLEDEGKRVWFRLGDVPGTPAHDAGSGHAMAVAESARPTTTVQLLALPVALYCVWQEHADALLRESTLLSLDEDEGQREDYPLAGRALSALGDAASDVFALREADAALADVTLEVSTETVQWFPILRDVLARATLQALAGKLLTPPSLPEVIAVRRWVCDEIARQSAGLSPTAWVEEATELTVPPTAPAVLLDTVRASSVAQIAADTTNRIIAVSQQAAEMLGWTPGDLEGHRLVAIIPPRLRDRHIAGFTRHLLEGNSRILGQAVRVPALRRDGGEVEIELLIERRADPTTRGLFVATLTPLG
ncbi:MAG TPA: PAS domain S-box protein [Mycobacteriales bacterium]|nr:PAS domain S-box protein [Mycobacteriales bacterium]